MFNKDLKRANHNTLYKVNSNGMIHVQLSLWNCACVKQVLIGWTLIFAYKVQWQQIHRTVEQFSTNQNPGYTMSPSVWLVENCSIAGCICCHWTLYPKINFQPMRTCLMHMQIQWGAVGHVPFRWNLPCIVCYDTPFLDFCRTSNKYPIVSFIPTHRRYQGQHNSEEEIMKKKNKKKTTSTTTHHLQDWSTIHFQNLINSGLFHPYILDRLFVILGVSGVLFHF